MTRVLNPAFNHKPNVFFKRYPTKGGGNFCNVIMHNPIWANKKTESFCIVSHTLWLAVLSLTLVVTKLRRTLALERSLHVVTQLRTFGAVDETLIDVWKWKHDNHIHFMNRNRQTDRQTLNINLQHAYSFNYYMYLLLEN